MNTARQKQAGQRPVNRRAAELALDVVADQRHAGFERRLLIAGVGDDQGGHPVNEADPGVLDGRIRIEAGGLVRLGGHEVQQHLGAARAQHSGHVARLAAGCGHQRFQLRGIPVQHRTHLDPHPKWLQLHARITVGHIGRGINGLRKVPPHFAGVDVEGRHGNDVGDFVAADLGVHQASGVIRIAPVMLDALEKRLTAVPYAGNRDTNLLLLRLHMADRSGKSDPQCTRAVVKNQMLFYNVHRAVANQERPRRSCCIIVSNSLPMTRYLSDSRPDFSPFEIDCGKLQAYRYQGSLADELARGRLNAEGARQLLEDMLTIRELEEMIVKLRSGAYSPLAGYNYRGPTHVSIGQEGTSAGASSALSLGDLITTTHRGHGDSLARGSVALRALSEEQLRARLPGSRASCRCERIEEALDDHVFRTIAELFGKEDGYCRGRGGSMHIADFSLGHLGANAIVGGNVPIATGAALALRYLRREGVVCCFAGDGAFSNGVVLESLNFAAQAQFSNELAGELRFGMPIIFLVVNNQYGMTHRTAMEVTGVRHLARRAAGFAENNLHAELVNGMDALAVRDAVLRAAEGCRQGLGPYFIEASTYRYYGHSLSDPRNEYRTKEEEVAWKEADPIASLERQILDAQILNPEGLRALQDKVRERNRRAAERAVASPDPDPAEVTKYLYTTTCSESVPQEFRQARYREPSPARRASTSISYRDAIREAMFEEMARDARVIFYGEDVADYGGAFKLTRGLLETFGRERVFNTPISEAAICGTAVGAAMAGLRPVVELMYMDFVLMASDQICNQAAKWHY
ncbi:MAG: hypothetical protein FJW37_05915, partial [Acidobacteria bacterium]|nr:hypothetical protein [Acidobacteriota bacterium]